MSESRKYPVGIQSFEKIIEGDYLYIDKTEYLHSLVKKENSICGITETELLTDMHICIENLAEANGISFEETCARLKTNYDGYRFSSRKQEGIYNPFSVLNVLDKMEFKDYWFHTGTPTMLIKLLKKYHVEVDSLDNSRRYENQLLGLDPTMRDPIPVLFQSGYLTIKGTEDRGGRLSYLLGFPNKEVERGFLNDLLPFYVNRAISSNDLDVYRFTEALEHKRIDEFMEILQSFLAGVPYDESGKDEIYENRFRDVLFIICRLMGMSVICEYHTHRGRIDMLVKTDRYIYVMDYKLDKTADSALQQIHEKDYALPFLKDGREVILVGVEFSTKKRNIVDWKKEYL
jgi:hypothetical protein